MPNKRNIFQMSLLNRQQNEQFVSLVKLSDIQQMLWLLNISFGPPE